MGWVVTRTRTLCAWEGGWSVDPTGAPLSIRSIPDLEQISLETLWFSPVPTDVRQRRLKGSGAPSIRRARRKAGRIIDKKRLVDRKEVERRSAFRRPGRRDGSKSGMKRNCRWGHVVDVWVRCLDPYLRLHRPLHTLLTYKSRCIWHSQAKYARTGQSLALLLVLRNPCLGSMMS